MQPKNSDLEANAQGVKTKRATSCCFAKQNNYNPCCKTKKTVTARAQINNISEKSDFILLFIELLSSNQNPVILLSVL